MNHIFLYFGYTLKKNQVYKSGDFYYYFYFFWPPLNSGNWKTSKSLHFRFLICFEFFFFLVKFPPINFLKKKAGLAHCIVGPQRTITHHAPSTGC